MLSKSLEDTQKFAKEILDRVTNPSSGATVLALSGELGSGKTAFVKALAKELGVEATVTSPTFVIEKIYKLSHPRFTHLVHVDAYRLESARELEVLGFRELLQNSENLVAIEWPERVLGVVPPEALRINFTFVNDAERDIVVLDNKL